MRLRLFVNAIESGSYLIKDNWKREHPINIDFNNTIFTIKDIDGDAIFTGTLSEVKDDIYNRHDRTYGILNHNTEILGVDFDDKVLMVDI